MNKLYLPILACFSLSIVCCTTTGEVSPFVQFQSALSTMVENNLLSPATASKLEQSFRDLVASSGPTTVRQSLGDAADIAVALMLAYFGIRRGGPRLALLVNGNGAPRQTKDAQPPVA